MIFKRLTQHIRNDNAARAWFARVPREHLTSAEKDKARALLQAYMEMHPVRPLLNQVHTPQGGVKTMLFSSRFGTPVMAFGLILALTTSTAYAAEGALPGDPLYAVKVHVTEEVRGVLSVGEKAQANWSIVRAERRLEEASTLAVKGTLTEKSRTDIETNLSLHIEAAENNQHLLAERDDTVDANEVEVRLSAVLNAHASVLGVIQGAIDNDTNGVEVGNLLINVSDRIALNNAGSANDSASVTLMSVAIAPAASEPATEATSLRIMKASSEIDTRSVRNTEKERQNAKNRISSATKAFSNVSAKWKGAEQTELWTRASAQLKAAQDVYAEGDAAFKSKEYGEASVQFGSALRIAADVEALLLARTHVLDELLKVTPKKSSKPSEGRRPSSNNEGTRSTILELATSSSPLTPTLTPKLSSTTVNQKTTLQAEILYTISSEDGSTSHEDADDGERETNKAIFHAIESFGF